MQGLVVKGEVVDLERVGAANGKIVEMSLLVISYDL